jgi:2-deoxy-D-gluconate 3-dehydrogenase
MAGTLEGKVALITGGGSGIGLATARAMAAAGARVALTELPGRGGLAKAAVAEIGQSGGDAIELALDVTATVTISSVVDRVADHFGSVDILVNNAGVQLLKPALEIDEEEFDAVLGVNLKGAFFCAQAAASVMADQGGGAIINVASQHGVVGNRNRAPYCASKGGLINLTRALALEWAGYGIRVNAVSPTFVANERNAELIASDEIRREIDGNIPLGCVADAHDVADGICYLASSAARMVTGHNLMVDGGWTAR